MFGFGVVKDITEVPQEYHGLYEQGSDGWSVTAIAKPLVDAYLGQSKALGDERTKVKSLNGENAARRMAVKALDDMFTEMGLEGDDKVAAIRAHVTDLQTKVKGGAELKVNLDKIKADMERTKNEALTEKDKVISKKDAALQKYLIKQNATSALTDEKGSVDLLLPHIERYCKVVEEGEEYVVRVVDAQGDFRSDGKGGWMGVKDLVHEMKSQTAYARAFESETPSGSGTRPGSTQQTRPKAVAEMTATQKIQTGLDKRQYSRDGR